MRRDILAPALLAVFVGLAVVIGLALVGGPGQGRVEQHDRERIQDLRILERLAYCEAREADGIVPDELSFQPPCDSTQNLTDPMTDAPYRYEKLGDTRFQLCADFATLDSGPFTPYELDRLDIETGCLILEYQTNPAQQG